MIFITSQYCLATSCIDNVDNGKCPPLCTACMEESEEVVVKCRNTLLHFQHNAHWSRSPLLLKVMLGTLQRVAADMCLVSISQKLQCCIPCNQRTHETVLVCCGVRSLGHRSVWLSGCLTSSLTRLTISEIWVKLKVPPVLLRQLDSLQMEVIGRTNEGREIRVVKINSNNTQVQHVKAMFDCSVAQNSEKIE